MKILFVWPNKDSFGFKPIGLSLLSSIARSMGFKTRLFDTTEIDFGFIDNTQAGQEAKIFKPVDLSKCGFQKKKYDLREKFKGILKDFKPDCLALSVLSDEFLIAARISQISKTVLPEVPVIWGGKYPSLNPEKALKAFYADFVCIGEGLDAFRDFLKAISKNGDLYGIPNIWGKKDGSMIKNNIRPLRKSLDDLPYADWEIFDKRQFYKPFNGKVYRSGDHMLNWGCPYHCTYCINHFYHEMYDNKYFIRRYGISRIIDELKYLKTKYELEFIKFHDEDFLLRPVNDLLRLSMAYKREVNIPFVIETNPKSVSRKKVNLLKDMNCVSASIAIEAGDPDIRKRILKRVDSEDNIIKAFSLFKEAGIRTVSFNMLGIPFESRDAFMKTVELNKRADVQYPSIGFFYPFEGTALREVAIKAGFFNPEDREAAVYRRDKPALHFNNLSEEELMGMKDTFVLYVKLPENYRPFIRQSEKDKNLRRKLLEIYENTVWKNDGWYIDDGLHDKYLMELNRLVSKKMRCPAVVLS